ncbi:abortive infection system antitoxin AbiGi family protein [Vallitalea sediminicola]
MSIISAETLFHFMKEFSFLEDVLNNKLSPRYYKEQSVFFNEPVYILMKCFCDIPLSLVKKHIEQYGCYAIGFNKKWGMTNRINPINYYNENSNFIQAIKIQYDACIDMITNNKSINFDNFDLNRLKKALEYTFMNYKPVRIEAGARDYYNEREWRYIPLEEDKDSILIKEDNIKQLYLCSEIQEEKIEEYNEVMKSYHTLYFELKDINFIIVKNNEEIRYLCKFFDTNYKDNQYREIVKTKIIKSEDIEMNF